jgi:hypothetical protein
MTGARANRRYLRLIFVQGPQFTIRRRLLRGRSAAPSRWLKPKTQNDEARSGDDGRDNH